MKKKGKVATSFHMLDDYCTGERSLHKPSYGLLHYPVSVLTADDLVMDIIFSSRPIRESSNQHAASASIIISGVVVFLVSYCE